MIKEENLAAATIAQLFGSELLKVQENTQLESGSVPQIVKLNPKQFLLGNLTPQSPGNNQSMLDQLQAEAEATYPLPREAQTSEAANASFSSEGKQSQNNNNISNNSIELSNGINKQLEILNRHLQKISEYLEKVDYIFKRNTLIEHETQDQ